MRKRRRVVSPRIVQPGGGGWRLLLVVFVLAAIGAAFAGGLFLGREEAKAVIAGVAELEAERDALSEQLAELKQEAIVLERTRQIDLEANRTAQEELKKAQDERLKLEREVSFFRRLIQEGGGGILRVQEFKLSPADEARKFGYSFTVTQLIQDFGESEGKITLKLAAKRDGNTTTLPLSKLPGSEPTTHKMKFRHFQNFEGTIVLPDDLEPENLVIEINPSTKKLLPLTETFAWNAGD
jgi:hypothetical protein